MRATVDLGHIGAVMRDRRERLGLLQRQVAERAAITPQHYGQIERGAEKARRITYIAIARALDLTVEEMDELTGGGQS